VVDRLEKKTILRGLPIKGRGRCLPETRGVARFGFDE